MKVRKPKLPNKLSLLPSKVNGRCEMRGGLCTGPTTREGRRRIAETNRSTSARFKGKRALAKG